MKSTHTAFVVPFLTVVLPGAALARELPLAVCNVLQIRTTALQSGSQLRPSELPVCVRTTGFTQSGNAFQAPPVLDVQIGELSFRSVRPSGDPRSSYVGWSESGGAWIWKIHLRSLFSDKFIPAIARHLREQGLDIRTLVLGSLSSNVLEFVGVARNGKTSGWVVAVGGHEPVVEVLGTGTDGTGAEYEVRGQFLDATVVRR